MPEFIYSMHNVRKALGDKVVLDNVTLSFYPGAKIGVVGPNGTGKSTLLKLMAGMEKPNNGDAMLAKDARVGILLQEPPLTEGKTVLENVEEAVADIKALQARMDELGMAMGEPDADFDALMAEMGDVQTELDNRNAWDIDSQLEQAMDALRCPPPDAMVDILSGGERRRVALCKLLLQQPDLLLLDEPTNHLDAESVHWLEGHLKAYPGAVLAVTHDRYFLDNVAEWILELDRGRTHPYEGNYSTYLDTKRSRLQVEGKRDAKRAKILERELEWARSNPKARQAKNKARLARYEEMAAEADRNRKLDFEEINIPAGPRLGSNVLEADQAGQGLRRPAAVRRARLLAAAGRHRRRGRSQRGRQVDAVPDDRRRGEPGRRRAAARRDGARSPTSTRAAPASTRRRTSGNWSPTASTHIKVASFEMPSRAYVASFGFKGPDQQKPAGVLSGGERNRLNLALTLKMGGNLLLLDEPTNDLDVETLQSLEDALLDFPGCAVVISHDRWFLDRVATHILAWEGDDEDQAQWFWFEGNFADYEANKISPARRRGRPPAPRDPPPADPVLIVSDVPRKTCPTRAIAPPPESATQPSTPWASCRRRWRPASGPAGISTRSTS